MILKEKAMKKISLMWAVSLMVISAVTLVIAFSNIFEFELPVGLKILLGVIDLAALVVLVYTGIKSIKLKSKSR